LYHILSSPVSANRNRIHQRAIVARGSKIWQRRAAAWVRPGEALINFEV